MDHQLGGPTGGGVNLSVSTERKDGVATVAVAGELDLGTGPRVDQEIGAAIQGAGTIEVVVDLSELDFLDSSGIAVLLRGRRVAEASGVAYRVDGASGMVRQVLELTGILQHLTGESV
jgi:anti-sigma B factor antagonist